jgi:hypothetical protein
MKHVLKGVTPPVVWDLARKLRLALRSRDADRDMPLFDGQGGLFEELAKGVRVYGEYGVGQSTRFIHDRTEARILAVDTSKEWVEATKASIGDTDRLFLEHVDLGELGEWGMPTTYRNRDKIDDYLNFIWTRSFDPDLVLIDGRFRVACFTTSLLAAKPGCRILFDDYVERPHYHVVEELLEPERVNARQALFVVPERFDRAAAARMGDAFRLVRD